MVVGALPELPPALGPPGLTAALAVLLAATACTGPWLAPRTRLYGSIDALMWLVAAGSVVTAAGVAAWKGHAPPAVLTLALYGLLQCVLLAVWCLYGFGHPDGGGGDDGGEEPPPRPRDPGDRERFPWWPAFERDLNAWAARRRRRTPVG